MADEVKYIRDDANAILHSISAIKAAITHLTGEYQKKVGRINRQYDGEMAENKAELKRLEKRIRAFSKKHKEVLFDGEDCRVDLDAGALIYTVQKRAKQIKGMVERLDELGRTDLMKIAKSANWDEIDKLNDVELEHLGSCRVEKEIFEYEVNDLLVLIHDKQACDHEWVSMKNEVIENGEICLKCNSVRH